MKCKKCKKTIDTEKGFFNLPSGPLCAKCGEKPAEKLWKNVTKTMRRFEK